MFDLVYDKEHNNKEVTTTETEVIMLNGFDKKNPFKVPENYFEDFHRNLMSQIAQEPESKIIPLWRKVSSWVAVAAVLVGVILLITVFGIRETGVQIAESEATSSQMNDKVLASTSSDEEDFYLYLENQVAEQSYYNEINF